MTSQRSSRALAIVSMLIFVFLFTTLAAILLTLLSSNTRLLEHYIRRIKAYYVAEAGSFYAADVLRRTGNFPALIPAVDWTHDLPAGNPLTTRQPAVTSSFSGLTCRTIDSNLDYTINW